MKASELINRLREIINKDGDLDVWIDSANEPDFADIKDVVGRWYSKRPSNDNPHIWIISNAELQEPYE